MEAILHIGVGKTGSSAIEQAVALNAGRLPDSGAWRPVSPAAGRTRHIRLAAYAQRDDRFTRMRRSAGVTPEGLAGFRSAFEDEFAREVETAPPDCRRAILCDVGCCSLTEAAEVERLAALMGRLFERTRILVYLRRQDEHAVSRFQQNLRSGSVSRRLLGDSPYHDYAAFLDVWTSGFGDDNLIVRIYPRTGDVIGDAFAAFGLDPDAGWVRPGMSNPRISVEGQLLLLAFNRAHRDTDGAAAMRTGLIERLREACPGTGLRPSRAAARDFARRFEASNEQVRRRWFPERSTLFDDDFSAYPDAAPRQAADAGLAGRAAQRLIQSGSGASGPLDAWLAEIAREADAVSDGDLEGM